MVINESESKRAYVLKGAAPHGKRLRGRPARSALPRTPLLPDASGEGAGGGVDLRLLWLKNSKDIAISAQSLNKVFNPGTDEEVIALQDINLEVAAGEFISLIGPVRLRQVDADAAGRRLAAAELGRAAGQGQGARGKRAWTATTAWSFKRRRSTNGAALSRMCSCRWR